PYQTKSVLYRITAKGDDDPASMFAQDARQALKNVQGNSFELHVQAIRSPQGAENPGEVKEEFLKSSANLNSDDPRIKDYTRQAVRQETDPWKKAQLIERWVYYHVELDNSAPFATAGEVARTLRGDCRHKAMLSAALCRAAGVPSRTAVGLIYDDHNA